MYKNAMDSMKKTEMQTDGDTSKVKAIPRSLEMQKKLDAMLKRDTKVANYLKEKEKKFYSNERANKVIGKTQ